MLIMSSFLNVCLEDHSVTSCVVDEELTTIKRDNHVDDHLNDHLAVAQVSGRVGRV